MKNQVEILKKEYNDKFSYNILVSLAISQGLYDDVLKFLEKVPSSEDRGRFFVIFLLSIEQIYIS